jgi:hypothetical protein
MCVDSVPVIWQRNCLSVAVILQNCLSVDRLPVIWQNCLYVYVEEHASDLLAELFVCGKCVNNFWQNCLSVDSLPGTWQNCLYEEERASDLAQFPVFGQCASDLAELPVCGGACQ